MSLLCYVGTVRNVYHESLRPNSPDRTRCDLGFWIISFTILEAKPRTVHVVAVHRGDALLAKMGVVILDGSTVRDFAENEEVFNKAVDPIFAYLDVNHDGVLSNSELRPAFERLNLIESQMGVPVHKTPEELTTIYDTVFASFDADHSGTVDLVEFRAQLKGILLSLAQALGSVPIQMVVEDEGLLQKAVDHEQAVWAQEKGG